MGDVTNGSEVDGYSKGRRRKKHEAKAASKEDERWVSLEKGGIWDASELQAGCLVKSEILQLL